MRLRSLLTTVFLITALASELAARQRTTRTAPPDPLTLGDAVRYGLDNYPAVRARMAEMSAAGAGVGLAETASLPRVDTLFAVNRATRNNVFGALFPQAVIPSLSGPVLPAATNDSTFGSAAGLSLAWEPFDFGLRRANVQVAEARRAEAVAQLELTRYQVAFAVADAYLAAAAGQQAARAAQASVGRLETVQNSIHSLVEAGLRAGADESRVQVELALARTRAIQADQYVAGSLATLAEMLGAAGATVHIDATSLLTAAPSASAVPAARTADTHPLTAASMASVHTSEARIDALDRSLFPKFTVQGALWARGTGALTDGSFLGGVHGLAPTTANAALGFSVTFPLSDFASLHEKKAIERETKAAETARYDQALQKVSADIARARSERESAEEIAENTPAEVHAARAIDEQSRARYQAGLATIVEVADAQRLLTQAEIDDAVARLGLWRARLSEAAASGDIQSLFK